MGDLGGLGKREGVSKTWKTREFCKKHAKSPENRSKIPGRGAKNVTSFGQGGGRLAGQAREAYIVYVFRPH